MNLRTGSVLGVATAVLFFAATSAFAHGKEGVHLKGTLKQISATQVVVDTVEKKEVTASLDTETKVERDDAAITIKDLVVGERIVVHAKKTTNGALKAQLLKVGKKKAAASEEKLPSTSTDGGTSGHGAHDGHSGHGGH